MVKKAGKKKSSKRDKRLSKEKQIEFIELAIEHVLKNAKGVFVEEWFMAEVTNRLKAIKVGNVSKTNIENEVNDFFDHPTQNGLAERYSVEEDDYIYIKCSDLFDKARFCIKPTAYELAEGILVPGHRFMPFCDGMLQSTDFILKDASGNELPKKTVKGTLNDFMVYHSLFGVNGMLNDAMEDEYNEDQLLGMEPNPELRFTVFDMRDLYKTFSMKDGDCLVATVEDYEQGICSIEHLPLEILRKSVDKISKWCELFAEDIDEVINNSILGNINNEFILANAFFMHPEYLLNNPVIHVGGFLAQSDDFAIHNVNGWSVIWHKDMDEDELDEPDLLDDFDDDDEFDDFMDEFEELISSSYAHDGSSLDQLFKILGYSISEEEMEAYMRDELYLQMNKAELSSVMQRCFDERHEGSEYADIKEQFIDEINEKWQCIESDYNRFADDRVGKIRSELLKINDLHLNWLRSLDQRLIELDKLPESEMMQLAEVFNGISDMLGVMNNPDEASDKELRQIKKMLPMIEQSVQVMMKVINDKI